MLSGWAGSGKDAAAALLIEEMGFTRLAFADALKVDVAHKTGYPLHYFQTALKDEPLPAPCSLYPAARTPRDILLQHALIERAKDYDIYAKHVAAEIEAHEQEGQHRFVISDWRYRNEYAILAGLATTGNRVVIRARIERPGVRPSQDPSEHDLAHEHFTLTIHNSGTISELRESLRVGLRPYLHPSSPRL
jgi:hypothetical protein